MPIGQVIAAPFQAMAGRSEADAARSQINKGMGENVALTDAERRRQTGYQQPYMQAGQRALGDLENFRMREANPYQAGQFGGVDMAQDPGVQYRMERGVGALDSSAANRGNLFSGPQQKALAQFGQDLGSQEFGNAYNRQYGQFQDAEQAGRDQFNTEADRTMNYDQFRMNQLQGLSGQGQQATNQLAGASQNLAGNQLANQMMLRGAKGDVNAKRAGLNSRMWGDVVGGAAEAGLNYYMGQK